MRSHVQKTIEKWQMVAYGLLGGSSDMLTTVSHIVDRNDDDMYVPITITILLRNFNKTNFINFISRYKISERSFTNDSSTAKKTSY